MESKESLPAANPYTVAAPRLSRGQDDMVLWPSLDSAFRGLCGEGMGWWWWGIQGRGPTVGPSVYLMPQIFSLSAHDSYVQVSSNFTPESCSGCLPSICTGANQFPLASSFLHSLPIDIYLLAPAVD